MITNAPTNDVLYQCVKNHISEMKYHAQVKDQDIPKMVKCKTCHQDAKYVAASITPTEEKIPDPKRLNADMRENEVSDVEEENDNMPLTKGSPGGFTRGHLKALRERRTEEELEALLESRLQILRRSRGEI